MRIGRIFWLSAGLIFAMISAEAQVGQIIWQDNFDKVDTGTWNIVDGNGCNDAAGCGWGNQELEYYQPGNVSVEAVPGETGNNALVIQAKRETVGSNQFTSAKLNSLSKMAIKYGVIEVRMKSPDIQTGLWPALWLMGTNHPAVGWPYCGEIDMMEMGQSSAERARQGFASASLNNYVGANLIWYTPEACSGTNASCAASIAYDTYYNQPYVSQTALKDRFVIYRMYWDESSIRFTVEDEGSEYDLYTNAFPITSEESVFQQPFYFIMNLAVGGAFTDATSGGQVTAPLPAKMYVDYVRVRKWNGKGEVFLPGQLMAHAGSDQTFDSGTGIVLDAGGSYGDVVSYVWSENGVQIATGETATVDLSEGTHVIELKIADGKGNEATDRVSIQVGSSQIGEVIWEENFDSFNSDIWNAVNSNGCDGASGCGFGNQELQHYNGESNLSIEPIAGETGNNALVIQAKRETVGSNQFTSAKITTENKLAVKYGMIEVRLKVPDLNKGLWPAVWLLGANYSSVGWPYSGEIDMMEMGQKQSEKTRLGYSGAPVNNFVGSNLIWYTGDACTPDNATCAASIAYDVNYNKPYVSSTPLNTRFVVYRMYWEESSIRFTVVDNGVERDLYADVFPITDKEAAFKQPFFLLMNMAVGGNFTDAATPDQVTAPLPSRMYVDYIKVCKYKGKGEVSYAGGSLLANAGADQVRTDLDKNGTEQVTLDGSGSYGDISSYVWTESGVQLATGKNPTINLASGDHYITLAVTGTNGTTSTDDVHIDVREILWEDNFNTLNTDIWNKISGDGCDDPAGCGWGNQELESYSPGNLSIAPVAGEEGNNSLVIEAKKETVGNRQFTSGKLTTRGNMAVRYGLIEVRLKTPDIATGLWPAVWMLGKNHASAGWPVCGEIDMMEMGHAASERVRQGFSNVSPNNFVGSNLIWYSPEACTGANPDCAASISYDVYYDMPYISSTGLNNRFVIYRLYWDEKSIRFTVEDEGKEVDLYTNAFPISANEGAFKLPFYMLMNLAVGGNFTDAATASQVTAPLPAKMLVDYVRVMKWNGKGEVTFGDNSLVANAGPDIIALDRDKNGKEVVFLDGSASSNLGGVISSYSWHENEVEIAAGVMPELEMSRGVHNITLVVTDDKGNSASDLLVVTVTAGGASPAAEAGEDRVVYDDNGDDLVLVTLDGSGSSDPNDAPLTYSWLENGVEIATGVNPSVTLKTGTHAISLVVSNEDNLTGSDEIVIRVIDPDNQAPVASAGSDQTINDTDRDDEAAVVLDGSGSSDSDGSIVSYSWTENGVEIAVGQKPSVILSTGKHLITLEVTDDDGISSTGEVLITIIDPYNVAPVAHAGSDALVVDENRDGVEKVSLDASASTDSDGTISAYVWTENDAEIASGKTAEVDLGLGVHQIVLTATDNDGASATAGVTIRVAQRPVADAGPDLTALDQDQDGSETVTLDASGSSAPFSTIVSYSWTENNAEIATGQSLNYTFAKGTHVLILTVANDYGLTASTELTVVVANPNNQAPVADAGDDVTLIDNANLKQVSYTLDGTASHDPDGAIISYVWTENNAVIATGETPSVDFAIGMHQVTLTVTDNEGASASDSFVITVKQGSCIIEPCTSDYIARVVSNDASNTTVTFEPTESGVGNSVCLFYYGTIENAQYPGHIVKPDEPFTLSGITMGQKVYFYYTYNMSNGLQQNTMNCKQSFTVGACSSETTELSDLYKQEISLYPSPVSDILQVSTTVDRIVISDLYGNPVMEDSHTARMNVSQLTPGLYIVYLVVNDQKTVRKIIKK